MNVETTALYLHYRKDPHSYKYEWMILPVMKTTKKHLHVMMPPIFGWWERAPDPYNNDDGKFVSAGELEATVLIETLAKQGNARASVSYRDPEGKRRKGSEKVYTEEAALYWKARNVWVCDLHMSATVSFNQCKHDIVAMAREAATDPTREMVLASIERNGGKVVVPQWYEAA